MNITLRPVVESDDPFLFELYASARASEMNLVPWTDAQKLAFLQMQFAAQNSSYAREFPEAQHQVICRDGEPVGRLYLACEPGRFHILDITVAPKFRNAGIGSEVLREVLREADLAGKATTIYVENFNPSVRLFDRLGFQVAEVRDFLLQLARPSGASEALLSEER